jgi:hypothetical protein
VVVGECKKAIGENRILTIGDAKMVFDVGGSLSEVEGFEMVADGDALVEGFVGGKAELVSQGGLAEEDESEQGSGIHFVVEQEAELVEQVMREKVSLVDDEESKAALAGEIREGSAELGKEAGEAEGRLGLEGEQDLMIEGRGRQVRIGKVDDGVEVAVEGVSEGAKSGRLAGADVAGDESRETFLESKGQASLDLQVTAGWEEICTRDGLAERGSTEAVEIIESGHGHRPPLDGVVRVAKSEWYRVVAG